MHSHNPNQSAVLAYLSRQLPTTEVQHALEDVAVCMLQGRLAAPGPRGAHHQPRRCHLHTSGTVCIAGEQRTAPAQGLKQATPSRLRRQRIDGWLQQGGPTRTILHFHFWFLSLLVGFPVQFHGIFRVGSICSQVFLVEAGRGRVLLQCRLWSTFSFRAWAFCSSVPRWGQFAGPWQRLFTFFCHGTHQLGGQPRQIDPGHSLLVRDRSCTVLFVQRGAFCVTTSRAIWQGAVRRTESFSRRSGITVFLRGEPALDRLRDPVLSQEVTMRAIQPRRWPYHSKHRASICSVTLPVTGCWRLTLAGVAHKLFVALVGQSYPGTLWQSLFMDIISAPPRSWSCSFHGHRGRLWNRVGFGGRRGCSGWCLGQWNRGDGRHGGWHGLGDRNSRSCGLGNGHLLRCRCWIAVWNWSCSSWRCGNRSCLWNSLGHCFWRNWGLGDRRNRGHQGRGCLGQGGWFGGWKCWPSRWERAQWCWVFRHRPRVNHKWLFCCNSGARRRKHHWANATCCNSHRPGNRWSSRHSPASTRTWPCCRCGRGCRGSGCCACRWAQSGSLGDNLQTSLQPDHLPLSPRHLLHNFDLVLGQQAHVVLLGDVHHTLPWLQPCNARRCSSHRTTTLVNGGGDAGDTSAGPHWPLGSKHRGSRGVTDGDENGLAPLLTLVLLVLLQHGGDGARDHAAQFGRALIHRLGIRLSAVTPRGRRRPCGRLLLGNTDLRLQDWGHVFPNLGLAFEADVKHLVPRGVNVLGWGGAGDHLATGLDHRIHQLVPRACVSYRWWNRGSAALSGFIAFEIPRIIPEATDGTIGHHLVIMSCYDLLGILKNIITELSVLFKRRPNILDIEYSEHNQHMQHNWP